MRPTNRKNSKKASTYLARDKHMAGKDSWASKTSDLRKRDDFQQIRGIGPATADRLHKAGIHTYTQLGSLSPAKLCARGIGLSIQQIARQDWVGQARKMASKKDGHQACKKETAIPTVRQHYEIFTLEFLLDEKNVIRRTRVIHVQSGNADRWAGWKAEHLIDFLTRHTKIHTPAERSLHQKIEMPPRGILQNTTIESGPRALTISKPDFPRLAKANLSLPVAQTTETASPSIATANLTGILRLQDLKVISINSGIPIFFLRQGQPYCICLTLDLAEVVMPSDISLEYKATIFGKRCDGLSQIVVEVSRTFKLSDSTALSLLGDSLPPGVYRLNAFVRLRSADATPGLTALLSGDTLQVY